MTATQVNEHGQLTHLLQLEGLSKAQILQILDTAASFFNPQDGSIVKKPVLRGRTVANLFFEPSTRTRSTFELAAKKLDADVLNLDIGTSATTKGESLLDTLQTLQAMHIDMFVIRHKENGIPQYCADQVGPRTAILNAGDGNRAHPTQGLLDAYSIRKHKGDFENLTVTIVGDIRFSRVARSQIAVLNTLGVKELRIAGPDNLLPENADDLDVVVHRNLDDAVRDADVVIMLRVQKERMDSDLIPTTDAYFAEWGLTKERLKLAKPDAIVMHPGPMNRGIEIASDVADGPQSIILDQVTNGIAVRMAVMSLIMSGRNSG
ncbi:MAG: aspartate carbamoyltransferase catalytic subunit [Gammaproteobacteria bacterium]|nr:aspartate carbamoyltransferase catalytic subunit [Gammaproteobacteria bacterium]